MKVYIGPHTNWIGPYQIADKLFFWCERYPSDELEGRWDYRLKDWTGEFLAHGFEANKKERHENMFRSKRKEEHKTWFYKLLLWIESKKKRKVEIRIDRYDHWNIDATLSPIILPLLKDLKKYKHGSGMVDLEDVPEHMRTTNTESFEPQQCFEFYTENPYPEGHDVHSRWDWVLDEMIWAFEQLQPDNDWEDQYSKGEIDWISVPCKSDENGKVLAYEMQHGPDHTYEVDWEGREKHQARINNGLRLFGKYYQNLWD